LGWILRIKIPLNPPLPKGEVGEEGFIKGGNWRRNFQKGEVEEGFIKGVPSPLSPPERRGCKGRLKRGGKIRVRNSMQKEDLRICQYLKDFLCCNFVLLIMYSKIW